MTKGKSRYSSKRTSIDPLSLNFGEETLSVETMPNLFDKDVGAGEGIQVFDDNKSLPPPSKQRDSMYNNKKRSSIGNIIESQSFIPFTLVGFLIIYFGFIFTRRVAINMFHRINIIERSILELAERLEMSKIKNMGADRQQMRYMKDIYEKLGQLWKERSQNNKQVNTLWSERETVRSYINQLVMARNDIYSKLNSYHPVSETFRLTGKEKFSEIGQDVMKMFNAFDSVREGVPQDIQDKMIHIIITKLPPDLNEDIQNATRTIVSQM
jgi:hypothetical protein